MLGLPEEGMPRQMTPAERERLWELLPLMREAAARKQRQNDYQRATNQCEALRQFLYGGSSIWTAAEWLQYAEREVEALEQQTSQ